MELKKSPKADLQNKRGLLLEIGLVVALALVVFAFAWTPSEHRIDKMDVETAVVEEDITEITRQENTPPPPPKQIEVQVLSDILQVVDNKAKIETDQNMWDIAEGDDVIKIVAPKEEVIEDDQPFLVAEQMPKFQGGDLNTFRTWVQSNLKYPQIAAENNIQGKVTVTFVIEKDGRLTNIAILQSPDRSLSEEATRVLQKSPKWTAGKQRNQPVRVRYNLPVDFRLRN